LKPAGTINAHAAFRGAVSTDPLDGLHFPGDQKREIIQQIEAALRSGKHIILTGPPGTGKTEIARRVCSHLASEYPYLYSDFQLTTATADWSTFDTVGGYMPESKDGGSDELSFTPGVVLNRIKERQTGRQVNEPLIIDELNRADIDKAFGQLFTLLSGQSVKLPYTRDGEEIELLSAAETDRRPAPHQYVVPESWRIFATMNTYDKTSLYEMSYAFMRRFAFIRVGAPSIRDYDDGEIEGLMHDYAEAWDIPLDERDSDELQAIGCVWREMNAAVEDRAIGPAIVKDIVEYVGENETIPLEDRLTRAVISYVFPQLEGVPKREQIVRQISNVRQIDADGLGDAAAEMLQVNIADDE
jgi:5-methylcytosine-specific restriction protein B